MTNIASLMNVTAEQITLKAEVTHVASVKHISQHHGQLQKQEIMLRHPTGTTKLVLWELCQFSCCEYNVCSRKPEIKSLQQRKILQYAKGSRVQS